MLPDPSADSCQGLAPPSQNLIPEAHSGAQAPGGSGLVELETSGKWNPLNPEIQRKRRLSRMRRAVLNGGDVLEAGYRKGGFRHRSAMVTLTYAPTVAWEPRHVAELLRHYRLWAARRGFNLGYVWTAELQKRGAVHYHLVLWLPKGLTPPKPDKQGWWPHGMTNCCWSKRPVGYLTKYASKGDDVRKFPRGLRLHGRGGLDAAQRRTVSWWLLPRYVRELVAEVGTVVRRASGGGWTVVDTGEWLPPWQPPWVEPCGA
jgi:hypothetical protein